MSTIIGACPLFVIGKHIFRFFKNHFLTCQIYDTKSLSKNSRKSRVTGESFRKKALEQAWVGEERRKIWA
jgi:hypothetical protein